MITDYFEQIVDSINQPTGARNFQAVFWNISYYDKFYFESLFENFVFPDGSKPDWDSLSWLQKRFMRWFNQERTRSILTFPVETMALLNLDYLTRIIGYMKRVSNFSQPRQQEAAKRHYATVSQL